MRRSLLALLTFAVLFVSSAGVSMETEKRQSKKSGSAECVNTGRKIEQALIAARKDLILAAKIEEYKLLIWEKTSNAAGKWVLFKIPLEVNLPEKEFGDSLVLKNPGITRTFSNGEESTLPMFNIHFKDTVQLIDFVRYVKQAQTVCK